MIIKQFYETCLSQASYYIEHNGKAAIVDPLRDISQYQAEAYKSGAEIIYIFETHFHADFVSGHLELSRVTGAQIIFGPGAHTGFECYHGMDNEIFYLDEISIQLLHTPGHTLESCCYLVSDELRKPKALFTGDTLFLGDVGRPDLAQDEQNHLTQEELAGMLYDSIKKQITPIPNDVIVYPGHGAGSACGKNLSRDTVDLLGNQRKTNYALNPSLSRNGFITILCADLQPAPAYFYMNVSLNRNGYEYLGAVYERGLSALNPETFAERAAKNGTIVLDVRSADKFAEAHVPGAINIGIDGSFAPWIGAIIPVNTPEILLVCEHLRERESITRLGRIGYHQCSGYLMGGIKSYIANGFITAKVDCIAGSNFEGNVVEKKLAFVDVRNVSEHKQNSIPGSINIPLLKDFKIDDLLDPIQEYLVYCAGGYRSMIFISLMKSRGFHGFINVSGGLSEIRANKNTSL